MRLRQIAPRNDLGRARVADIDGGEVFRRALMGEPQDAAAVLGDLDRHALADAAKAVKLVMRQLPEIPNCRVDHASNSRSEFSVSRPARKADPSAGRPRDLAGAALLIARKIG